MTALDIRDIAIIDAFPAWGLIDTVLNVGCGEGRISYHLAGDGYDVHSTDVEPKISWKDVPGLKFYEADIFNVSLFSRKINHVVVCSEVLEHLSDYKKAFINLISLANMRLIITIPWKRSFNNPGHVNRWADCAGGGYKDVAEFVEMGRPYSVSISKIRTKPGDVEKKQYGYLIVVDKRQKYNSQ